MTNDRKELNRVIQLKRETEKSTKPKLTEEQRIFLTTIREMNIEARYREYKSRIAASLNENNTRQLLEQTKQMKQWILQQF